MEKLLGVGNSHAFAVLVCKAIGGNVLIKHGSLHGIMLPLNLQRMSKMMMRLKSLLTKDTMML